MKGRRSLKTAALFSLLVFSILTATMILSMTFAVFLFRIGFLSREHIERGMVIFPTVCVVIGTALSRFAGKRPIGMIVKISEATKEVAKGNFDVRIEENIPVAELRDMARSFNSMARELANTELLRNDFVENVSHEFKTPLSAIEGYAALLQKPGLGEVKRAEYTGKILYNIHRLSTLTSNILLLSRLEHQELDIPREIFCLDEQLREAILQLEPQWGGKRLELDVDLDSADCRGNRDLLAHVWQNLLGNAVKFTPKGGMVRVLLRRKGGWLSVTVADTGPGMSEEVRRRVFEKFYQGDSSRASQGNGLGLALAKRIVDLHGGTIEISSEEGRGTSFTVMLPS